MNSSHYLSQEERNAFKELLRKEYKDTQHWLTDKRNELIGESHSGSDPIDMASEQEQYLTSKREVTRKKERLIKIELSLKNLEDFGYCNICGIEIGKERLKIDATFDKCFDCADFNEAVSRNFIK